MRQLNVGTTALLECENCDGVWVDGETFEALCADREAQAAVLHHTRTGPSRHDPSSIAPASAAER